MFQHCQSATAEMLKFSVFPWLYRWGKGWVGSSRVCRENKWHFVLSFAACEISLVQTENKMLSWEQETQWDNHLKSLINQPCICPLGYSIQIMFPLATAAELPSLLIALPQRSLSCGCAEPCLGTRLSLLSISWIQPRLHWGVEDKVAFCHQVWAICLKSRRKAPQRSGRWGVCCRAGALSCLSDRPDLFFLEGLMVFISFGTGISNIFISALMSYFTHAIAARISASVSLLFLSFTNGASSFVGPALAT